MEVFEYSKLEMNKEMLINAVKGGVLGAGVVFGVDFILSKFLHNGKIRAVACAVAPIGLAMWLQEKNPELAQGIAIGGAGAGIYKLIQAFLYEKLNIPYAGYDYGYLEAVPAEQQLPELVIPTQETQEAQNEYGMLVAVPEEQEEVEVVGTSI